MLLATGTGTAQQLTFGVQARSDLTSAPKLTPQVHFTDLRESRWRVDFRLAGGLHGPLALGVGARTTTSFGPIGNLVLRGRLDVDTGGALDAAIAGEGVIGPVAARARLSAFNVNPGHFQLERAFARDARPRYLESKPQGTLGFELKGGLTYRLTRTLIAEVDPAASFVPGVGFGAEGSASLRIAGLVDRDDGVVLFQAQLTPGLTAGYVATGFEYRLNRVGMPLLRVAGLVGTGSEGTSPGVRFRIASPVARPPPPMRYGLEVGLEPYRTDVPSLRADASLSFDAAGGELTFRLLTAWPADELPPLGLLVRFRVSL